MYSSDDTVETTDIVETVDLGASDPLHQYVFIDTISYLDIDNLLVMYMNILV